MTDTSIIPTVAPSGTGCVECLEAGGWWLHLRRCAQRGHIGCCDSSPSRHATAHTESSGHPVIRSFEPGEDWFYDYRSSEFFNGPRLVGPEDHHGTSPYPAQPAEFLRTGKAFSTERAGLSPFRPYGLARFMPPLRLFAVKLETCLTAIL